MKKLLSEYIAKIYLAEYTDKEKKELEIPLDAISQGRYWYRGDTYIGKVVDGKFRPARDGEKPPDKETPTDQEPDQTKPTDQGTPADLDTKRGAKSVHSTGTKKKLALLRTIMFDMERSGEKTVGKILSSLHDLFQRQDSEGFRDLLYSSKMIKDKENEEEPGPNIDWTDLPWLDKDLKKIFHHLAQDLNSAHIGLHDGRTFSSDSVYPDGKRANIVPTEKGIAFTKSDGAVTELQIIPNVDTETFFTTVRTAYREACQDDEDTQCTEEEIDRHVNEALSGFRSYNDRIEFLQNQLNKGMTFIVIPEGEEGVRYIMDGLKNIIQNPIINEQLDAIASAEDTEHISTVLWPALLGSIGKSKQFGAGSVPILCEHLGMGIDTLDGQSVLYPESETFPLADYVALGGTSIIGTTEPTSDVRSVNRLIDLVKVALDILSIKKDLGAASAVHSRIINSRYKDPKVQNVLFELARKDGHYDDYDRGAHNDIYDTNEETFPDLEKKYHQLALENMPTIRKFYGIPEPGPDGKGGFTDEQIIEELSKGKTPICKKGEFNRFGTEQPVLDPNNREYDCPPGTPLTDLNRKQMGLYFLNSLVFDAIYNSNVSGQSFVQMNFQRGKIVRSNPPYTMCQSRAQLIKQLTRPGGCRDKQKPPVRRDDGHAAFLKVVPKNKVDKYCH